MQLINMVMGFKFTPNQLLMDGILSNYLYVGQKLNQERPLKLYFFLLKYHPTVLQNVVNFKVFIFFLELQFSLSDGFHLSSHKIPPFLHTNLLFTRFSSQTRSQFVLASGTSQCNT